MWKLKETVTMMNLMAFLNDIFRRIGHQQGQIQESCRRNGLNIRRIGRLLSEFNQMQSMLGAL